MAEENVTRKLAAILYADVAGYSRLTGADEIGTHRQLSVSLDLMADRIRNSGGQVMHYAGDAVLASFESVVAATNCAIGIQRAIRAQCAELPEDRRLLYRIGINLGEVIVDRGEIYGDGVNVAARLESLADPGGICVSASVHEQVRDKIDARFKDMGNQSLKNIERPVQAYRVITTVGSADAGDTSSDAMLRLSAFPKLVAPATQEEEVIKFSALSPPSIMILPFKNLSDDDDLEALVDGFRLSIQSTLVKLSGLFLINAPVAETYRHRQVSAIQAGNEVGIRYVLDGAVQMAGDRIRVTVQLTDAPAAQVIWADRYDRVLDDIFELQDEITTEVAVALNITVVGDKKRLIWWDHLPNWKAREYALRGLSHLYKGNEHDNALARRMFEELDQVLPDQPQALALMALTHWFDAFRNWSKEPAESVERAAELAQKAVALGDPDGLGHVVLGHVRLFQRRHDEALSLSEQAATRRLSCPLANGVFADVLHYCGKPEQAIKQIKKAVLHARLYPAWMANVLAESYRDTGQIISSIAIAQESLRLDPENLNGHAILCTAYSLADSPEDARRVVQEMLGIDASFSIARYIERQPYKDNATLEVIVKALREAVGLSAAIWARTSPSVVSSRSQSDIVCRDEY
jgi:class 3 adenylate cyclase/TolB-like protein/tetratricopeptide (TPR) repeat protein